MSHGKHINESRYAYEWIMSIISMDMNESCPIWMSHVPYEWVMLHMNESCPIWMRHVAYGSCPSYQSVICRMYKCVMAHISMSHGTRMNESCPSYQSVICPTYEWVMTHLSMSHGTRLDESCPSYQWVICLMYEWVMTHISMHAIRAVTHLYLWVTARTEISHVQQINESHLRHQ